MALPSRPAKSSKCGQRAGRQWQERAFLPEEMGSKSKAGEAGSASETAGARGTDPRSGHRGKEEVEFRPMCFQSERTCPCGSEAERAPGASGGTCAAVCGHQGSAARRPPQLPPPQVPQVPKVRAASIAFAFRLLPPGTSHQTKVPGGGGGGGGPWTKALGKNPFVRGHRKPRPRETRGHESGQPVPRGLMCPGLMEPEQG